MRKSPQRSERIVRLKVELDYVSPIIWWRIELPCANTFRQLHEENSGGHAVRKLPPVRISY